jgi:hypothetical protein
MKQSSTAPCSIQASDRQTLLKKGTRKKKKKKKKNNNKPNQLEERLHCRKTKAQSRLRIAFTTRLRSP